MKQDFFKTMNQVINTFENINQPENEEIECIHDLIELDGFNTCRICGTVLEQVFKTIDANGFEFTENKIIAKTKYSQIKEIRMKFMDYIISHQNKVSDEDFNKFVITWKNYEFVSLTRKNIMKCINDNKLNISDIGKYYCIIKNKKNIVSPSTKLDNKKINHIIELCNLFICHYKTKIKNINKRALIYIIVKTEYNILLDDYINLMKPHIIEKYDKLYQDFKNKK